MSGMNVNPARIRAILKNVLGGSAEIYDEIKYSSEWTETELEVLCNRVLADMERLSLLTDSEREYLDWFAR